ncbi:MAG: TolB family protein, partial [Planctomycetota bacterium]
MFWSKKQILNLSTVLMFVASILLVGSRNASADSVFGTPTAIPASSSCSSPSVSTDGLSLYVDSQQPGGYGGYDLYVFTRGTIHEDWSGPVNLGPTVNSSYSDGNPDISADGLTLFFNSNGDIWLSTRATTDEPWSEPVNLGPTINGPYYDGHPSVSTDGLSLFFMSERPGYGGRDIYVSTRATTNDPWSEPENLGPIVNSPSRDSGPDISSDGLKLFFDSERPGGYGLIDIWLTTRKTLDAPWSEPVNLGPIVNTPSDDLTAGISADGSILYFCSNRSGGYETWQVSIEPIVDFNGDRTVNCTDLCVMISHWGTSEPLCDIGPTPLGDSTVDCRDLA